VVAASSEPTSAAPKKLQTTARREAGRHRVSDDGAAGYYDYTRAAQFARGKTYARDNWYLHEASWRWSW
jgi:hypothetical protein